MICRKFGFRQDLTKNVNFLMTCAIFNLFYQISLLKHLTKYIIFMQSNNLRCTARVIWILTNSFEWGFQRFLSIAAYMNSIGLIVYIHLS